MTLLDAEEYDPEKARKRRNQILSAVALLLIVARRRAGGFAIGRKNAMVGHFFDALQKQDYKTAYGIWMHDPEWAAASRRASEISLQRFLSRLGTGRRVGTDQDAESLWRERLPRRRQRSGCGCDRERPHRTCAGVGGKIGQYAKLSALRTDFSLRSRRVHCASDSRVFVRLASSLTLRQVFDRSICRISPHRTFPGPTSMNVCTPLRDQQAHALHPTSLIL